MNSKFTPSRSVPVVDMGTTITKFALVAALLLLFGIKVSQATTSSARSLAMGGAHLSLANGPVAGRFNPANLALQGYRNAGIEFIGIGARLSNNAFNLDDYNKYTGAFLTDQDKAYLLGRVPADGLRFDADVAASAMTIGWGKIAFDISATATVDVNLSKDVVDLILNGNQINDSIVLNGTRADGLSIASASLSIGLPLASIGSRQLVAGVTGKYLYGLGYQEVTELNGMAITTSTGFAGAGNLLTRTAMGGRGYAADLGVAMNLSRGIVLGAKVSNVLSSMNWNKDTKEFGYQFSFDTATVENLDEDYILSEEIERDIPSFQTSLPKQLTVGLAQNRGWLRYAVDWTQGFENRFSVSKNPEIAAGVELRLIGFLPLRAGVQTGGDNDTRFSGGAGIKLLGLYVDAAVVGGSSLSSTSSTGAHVALSTGFAF